MLLGAPKNKQLENFRLSVLKTFQQIVGGARTFVQN